MSIGSRIQGLFSTKKEFELKSSSISQRSERPDVISIKETPFGGRVPRDNLEAVYMESPVVFNTINKITQLIMSTNYKLEGDATSVKFFEDFLYTIGQRGGNKTWNSLLYDIFKYQFIYGIMPVELIYNEEETRIVDLDEIDPKRLDYAKTGNSIIAVDADGNPQGFVQVLFNTWMIKQRFEIPTGVVLQTNGIYIPSSHIALFKLYTVGEGWYPIGLVEPIYNTYIRHKAAEEGFATAAYRVGNPVPYAKVGSKETNIYPSEDQIKKAAEELRDMNAQSTFASAWYHDIKYLEVKYPRDLRTFLDYWVDMEIAGMGVAAAFATGGGEDTNRSTLNRQEYIMKLALRDIIQRTCAMIETKIFGRIAKLETANGNTITTPRLVYNEIALEEMDSKASRLQKYASSGLLQPTSNIDEYIRRIEELPDPQPEEVKKAQEQAVSIAKSKSNNFEKDGKKNGERNSKNGGK